MPNTNLPSRGLGLLPRNGILLPSLGLGLAITALHGRRRGRKLPDPVVLKSPEGLDKPPTEPPLAAKVIEYPTFDPSELKGRVDTDIVDKVARDMKVRREARVLEKTERKKQLKIAREEEEIAFIMSFFDD